MEIKHIVSKEIEETKDILCDSCGKSCYKEYGFEYMKLETHWGFMSNKDLEHWQAHLCEQCVDEKLSFVKFKKDVHTLGPIK